ncbi:hypothetical protein [Streptomyces sp. NPDC049915]|uniref:hypothetical protein n=1 Tax=Streptomyces sp. NPDC049915 TaxID=3155510 RepID=UPI00343102C8
MAVEQRFRMRADRLQGWGIGLVVCAVQCAATRDWPRPLAALVISVPLSATGAALLTAGTVITRLRHHDDELQRAKK